MAATPLAAFVSGARAALADSGLGGYDLTIDRVHRRPGAETSVGFVVEGAEPEVYVVVTDADLEPGPNVAVARQDDRQFAAWVHPHDPMLPGLTVATRAADLAALLERHLGTPLKIDELTMLTYRPMRRAVVRVVGEQEMYIKVGRPDRVGRIVDAAIAAGAATVPVADLGQGILLSPAAPGVALLDALTAGVSASAVLDAVERALDALPQAVCDLPKRASWTDRRDEYADALRVAGHPDSRVDAVLAAINGGLAAEAGPEVPVHGDLNLANVRVTWQGSAIDVVSLIDIDTCGPGVRVDDYACLVAHAAALEALDPVRHAHMPGFARELAALAVTRRDAASVHARAGAVLMSLAASTEDRAVASEWLDLALGYAATRMPTS